MTDQQIEHLINCPKTITQPPRRTLQLNQGHLRNSFEMQSDDGEHTFSAFIRQNAKFPEGFTIGLKHKDKEGHETTLLRCNGMHGEHSNNSEEHFCDYHIHIAKAENIIAGLLPEKYAEITKEYMNLDDALAYFVVKCNIQDAYEYFPHLQQPRLFEV